MFHSLKTLEFLPFQTYHNATPKSTDQGIPLLVHSLEVRLLISHDINSAPKKFLLSLGLTRTRQTFVARG